MKFHHMLIAQGSNQTTSGLINIWGVLRNITATSLPAMHPGLHVLVFADADCDDDYGHPKNYKLVVTVPGGDPLSVEGQIQIERGNDDTSVFIDLQLIPYQCLAFGAHMVEFYFDDEKVLTAPFNVLEVSA